MSDQQPALPRSRAFRSSWRRRLSERLWGYDYFVSYHWGSGGAYAVALAQRLRDRGYDVFLDRAEYAMGDDWKGVGERALRRTQRLVLVATREAVTASKPVEHEVELFTARGRQVIPVVFFEMTDDGKRNTLADLSRSEHLVLRLLPESHLYIEEDLANLPRGPSDGAGGVLEQLTHTYRVMRRRDVRALVLLVVAAVLTGFAAFATLSYANALTERNAALRAAEAEGRAKDRANEERNRAVREARIAEAGRLAALADANRDKRLDLAALLAVEAVRTEPTPNTRSALLSVLQARPRIRTFLHGDTGRVTSVAFSPDGKTLAAGAFDHNYQNRLMLWDLSPGAAPTPKTLAIPEGRLQSVAFSPDGRTLAGGYATIGRADEERNGVILWESGSLRRLSQKALGKRQEVRSVAFSPDGATLAASHGYTIVGGSGGGVMLWDVSKSSFLAGRSLDAPSDVASLAFSPDGRTLAGGFGSGTYGDRHGVQLWDTPTGRPRSDKPLAAAEGDVVSVAFGKDGKTLAAGTNDPSFRKKVSSVILWNTATLERVDPAAMPVPEGDVGCVAFSNDGKTLAAGFSDHDRGGGAILWDVATRGRLADKPVAVPEGEVRAVAFGPHGNTLATAFGQLFGPGGVVLWDLTAPQLPAVRWIEHREGAVAGVALSPDRSLLAAGCDTGEGKGCVVLRDLRAEGSPPVESLPLTEGRPANVFFSPDGQSLLACYTDRGDRGGVAIWSVATRQRLPQTPLKVKGGKHARAAVGPDGRSVAIGYQALFGPGDLVVWDVPSRRQLDGVRAEIRERQMRAVAFSPDGHSLVAGFDTEIEGGGGGLTLWDFPSGRRRGERPLTMGEGRITSLAFSPDGETLAVAYTTGLANGHGVVLWDTVTGERVVREPLAVPEGETLEVAFGTDGKTLAVAFRGLGHSGIVLWDAVTRQRTGVGPLAWPPNRATSLAYSADGQTLAVGCVGPNEAKPESGVLFVAVGPDSWIPLARRIANRNLTRAEWTLYFPGKPYRPTFADLPSPPE
jgi:WD40 repeat protein